MRIIPVLILTLVLLAITAVTWAQPIKPETYSKTRGRAAAMCPHRAKEAYRAKQQSLTAGRDRLQYQKYRIAGKGMQVSRARHMQVMKVKGIQAGKVRWMQAHMRTIRHTAKRSFWQKHEAYRHSSRTCPRL